MLDIRRAEHDVVFNGRSGDDGISRPKIVRKRELLDQRTGTDADPGSQRQDLEREVPQKCPRQRLLTLVRCALQQLKVRLRGNLPLRRILNGLGRLDVATCSPNQHVGVKDPCSALRATGSSRHQRSFQIRPTCQ